MVSMKVQLQDQFLKTMHSSLLATEHSSKDNKINISLCLFDCSPVSHHQWPSTNNHADN